MISCGRADVPSCRQGLLIVCGSVQKVDAGQPQLRISTPEDVTRLALAIAAGGMSFRHGVCIGYDGAIGSMLYDPV